MDADYEAKRAPLYADYEAKCASLYADYEAKRATLYADYEAKRATLDAEILAYIKLNIPDCSWNGTTLVFPQPQDVGPCGLILLIAGDFFLLSISVLANSLGYLYEARACSANFLTFNRH